MSGTHHQPELKFTDHTTNSFGERLLDHPIRHVIQNLAMYVPPLMWLREKIVPTTTGSMNDFPLNTAWARQVADELEANGIPLDGARLAEVGPGHSLGIAYSLLLGGAEQVAAVDVVAFADPTDTETFEPIVEYCRPLGLVKPGADSVAPLGDKLHYAIVDDAGAWPVEPGGRDAVYSYYAGEHLKHPGDTLDQAHRALRPGGLVIFAIDLRDHYRFDGNWLEFLNYSDLTWAAMSSKRRFCNRLLAPRWRELFEARFELVKFDQLQLETVHPDFDPKKLHKKFRGYSIKDITTSHLWVVARKMAASLADAA
ncbi:MAG: class I SAM-dependent methyltransferase [Planctomycetota bacterium]